MGLHRVETIYVDTNMVAIDVLELTILIGVKLHRKYMVACFTVVLVVEEPQVLGWQRTGEILVSGDEEGHAISTLVRVGGEDAEDEADRKRLYITTRRRAEV